MAAGGKISEKKTGMCPPINDDDLLILFLANIKNLSRLVDVAYQFKRPEKRIEGTISIDT